MVTTCTLIVAAIFVGLALLVRERNYRRYSRQMLRRLQNAEARAQSK